MSILNRPTLVLNKSWIPIRIEKVRDSFSKGFSKIARFIDPDTYSAYQWKDWLKIYSCSIDDNYDFPYISTVNMKIRVPEVIVLANFNRIPKVKVKLSRRNLFIRDNFYCQYTGEKLTMSTGTMDHIMPKSRGGKTEWSNVVLCSLKVNIKKANRTPSQAGLMLLKEPKEPVWNPIYTHYVPNKPDSWKKFLRM